MTTLYEDDLLRTLYDMGPSTIETIAEETGLELFKITPSIRRLKGGGYVKESGKTEGSTASGIDTRMRYEITREGENLLGVKPVTEYIKNIREFSIKPPKDSDMKVLLSLYARPMTPRHITSNLEMPESTVYRVLTRLEKKGYISRTKPQSKERSKGGPRPRTVYLTDEGEHISKFISEFQPFETGTTEE